MILIPEPQDHWRLLTRLNIQTRKVWAWGHSVQLMVAADGARRYPTRQLIITSDYSGEHSTATHLIYCYLVISGGGQKCMAELRSARQQHLNQKLMSYKKLGDFARQRALVPFLSAAADLDGHLVAIAVDKRKKWLSTQPGSTDKFMEAFDIKGRWNPRSFEGMMRKTHLFAVIGSMFAAANADITWITDADQFVGNSTRHDDALAVAGRLTSMYLPYPMGTLRLNTTAQDAGLLEFEDLCAIPDLAAGMLSEVVRGLSHLDWCEGARKTLASEIPTRTSILADWFWDSTTRLRKTLIAIETEGGKFAVRKIEMLGGVQG